MPTGFEEAEAGTTVPILGVVVVTGLVGCAHTVAANLLHARLARVRTIVAWLDLAFLVAAVTRHGR